MDLTGNKKYSGRSDEVRRLSAGGDFAARRAIPTSGGFTPVSGTTTAARVPFSGEVLGPAETAGDGGQSATFVPGLLLCGSLATGARSAIPFFGLCVLGQSGKRDAVVGDAMRRRAKDFAGEGNDIGDIAHLEARAQYFAFCSPSQQVFSLCIRPQYTCDAAARRIRSSKHVPELPTSLVRSILPWPYCRSIGARHPGGVTEYVSAFILPDMLGAVLRQLHN